MCVLNHTGNLDLPFIDIATKNPGVVGGRITTIR